MRRRLPRFGGKRVLAFAGIGDPARFFNTLRANGIDVVRERAFADHHPYSQGEIENLIAEAKTRRADAGDDGKGSGAAAAGGSLPDWAQQIVPFAVTLEFDDATLLRKFVADRLFKARERNCTP